MTVARARARYRNRRTSRRIVVDRGAVVIIEKPTSARIVATLAIAAVATLVCAWRIWETRSLFVDDAYISLRYARNLVEHGDLSWNVGDRVEGYTNLAWTLLEALLLAAGAGPETAARILGWTAGAGLLLATLALARRVAVDAVARATGVAGVAMATGFAVWVNAGLEALAVAALLTAGAVVAAPLGARPSGRRALAAGAIFAAAYLFRPDALLPAGFFCAVLHLRSPAPMPRRINTLCLVGAVVFCVVAAHVLWRWGYYGDILPNTFRAKVGPPTAARVGAGLDFVILTTSVHAPTVFLSLAVAALLAVGSRLPPIAGALAAATAAQTIYVVVVGGDFFVGARLMIPILGFSGAILAVFVDALPIRQRIPFAAACLVLFAVASPDGFAGQRDRAATCGRAVATNVVAKWPTDTVIALNTAGSTPFFADGRVYIDMLGLNDRAGARGRPAPKSGFVAGHVAGDARAVLSRDPDFVVLGPAHGTGAPPLVFPVDVEMVGLDEFRECYAKRMTRISKTDADAAACDAGGPTAFTFTYFARSCPRDSVR